GKRHAAMVINNPEAELVAIVDLRPKEDLGLGEVVCSYFSSVDALLRSGMDFDVANIAVPNGLHAILALQLLHAGKDVVIEKPMTLSVADAERIVQAAEEKGRNVFVVMQNRYSPPSVWLKDLVASG